MTAQDTEAAFDILTEIAMDYSLGEHTLSRSEVKYFLGTTDVGPGVVRKNEDNIYFEFEEDTVGTIKISMEQHGKITYVKCDGGVGRCYKGKPIPNWFSEEMTKIYIDKKEKEQHGQRPIY